MIVLVIIGILFVLFIFYTIVIEPVYAFVFRKPVYVHFYPIAKKLKLEELEILTNEFDFYKNLPKKYKIYFEHRVATFMQKYPIYGKEGLVLTPRITVLIAATAIMLTFGFRKYLFDAINKIVVFPDIYYSKQNDAYHKGEFNPPMRAVAFSWKHFLEGYEIANDNLNLGLHEFAHVLHFEGIRNTDTSATLFAATYEEIMQQVQHPPNYLRLIESSYFRIYAYTNKFEFVAVILEHFFETPFQFKAEFPELYHKVKVMINFHE